MVINTRSPYFVFIEDSEIEYAELKIYIWEGDKNNPPTEEEYFLRKSVISSTTKVSFEVSELIRDFIEFKFSFASIIQDGSDVGIEDGYSRFIITGTDSGDSVIWVKLDQKAFDSSKTQLPNPKTETKLALSSYSYFQNSEFNIEDSSILISNRNVILLRGGSYNLPIYTKNNPTVVLYNGSTVVKSESYTLSDLSDEQVGYFDVFNIQDVSSIVVTDDNGSETIKLSVVDECKQVPSKVTFINKFGALENVYFVKKFVEKMNVSRESYKANILTYV